MNYKRNRVELFKCDQAASKQGPKKVKVGVSAMSQIDSFLTRTQYGPYGGGEITNQWPLFQLIEEGSKTTL